MKYAIIADVHGNFRALQAVLADAKKAGVDRILYAGDCVSGLCRISETVALMRKTAYKAVAGNGEDHLRSLQGVDLSERTDGQLQLLYWSYKALSDEDRDYLLQLPVFEDFEDGETELHMGHSSAAFFGQAEVERFSSVNIANNFARYEKKRLLAELEAGLLENEEFREALELFADGIYIFGHTHLQWSLRFDEKLFVNPGSCGMPTDLVLGACYTLLTVCDGQTEVEERRISYDLAGTAQELVNSDLWTSAPVFSRLFHSTLTTAVVHDGFFLEYAEAFARSAGDTTRPYGVATLEAAYKSWVRAGRPNMPDAHRNRAETPNL